jgi:hypothetical protein
MNCCALFIPRMKAVRCCHELFAPNTEQMLITFCIYKKGMANDQRISLRPEYTLRHECKAETQVSLCHRQLIFSCTSSINTICIMQSHNNKILASKPSIEQGGHKNTTLCISNTRNSHNILTSSGIPSYMNCMH